MARPEGSGRLALLYLKLPRYLYTVKISDHLDCMLSGQKSKGPVVRNHTDHMIRPLLTARLLSEDVVARAERPCSRLVIPH